VSTTYQHGVAVHLQWGYSRLSNVGVCCGHSIKCGRGNSVAVSTKLRYAAPRARRTRAARSRQISTSQYLLAAPLVDGATKKVVRPRRSFW
jgi:hypothetical protein